MSVWTVILAGGVGARFWPLSTPARPKQLLPLIDSESLLANSLRRMAPLAPPERTLVLTNAGLRDSVAAIAAGVPAENIIVEPRPAGTAAALAWAACDIYNREKDGVMVSIHSDWAVRDEDRFRAALRSAATLAASKRTLVTVGVVPTRPDTGFGYIVAGEPMGEGFRVSRFVEKPDRPRAEELLSQGALWNSGIFAWRVDDFLEEVKLHAKEVSGALAKHGTEARNREAFFSSVESVAVDVAVLERSDKVLVVRGDFGWDDIGTWGALRRARTGDSCGNVAHGPLHATDATGNVVHTENGTVVLYGVHDLVVVAREGLTFVTTVDKSEELKKLVDSLPPELRGQI